MAYPKIVVPGAPARRSLGPDSLRFGDTPERRLQVRRMLGYQFGAYDTIEGAARYDAEQRRYLKVERELARSGGSDHELDAGGLGRRAKRAVLRHTVAPGRPRFIPEAIPTGQFGIAPVVVATAATHVGGALIRHSADAQRQAQAANAKQAALAGNVTAFEYLKGRASSMPDPKHGFTPAMADLQLAGASDGSRLLVQPQWREPGGKALFDFPGSPGFATTPGASALPATGPVPSGAPPGWTAQYPTTPPPLTYAPQPLPPGGGAPPAVYPTAPSPGWLQQFLAQLGQGAGQAYAPPSPPAPAAPSAPTVIYGPPAVSNGKPKPFDAGSLLVPALVVGGLLIATRR